MGHTIRPMTEEELEEFAYLAALEGLENDAAVRQSHDRTLMLTELSEYDLAHMQEIIKEDMGTWFHAKLLRALHELLREADGNNLRRLRLAYPGTCAAYMAWYNGRIPTA
ncbi:hypothetical protein LCGC14_1056050 [marine sediment metagenome]|uniref:Uncharacterized protein n=1 Tax=marine sediment metagenome TaxID=412755 RepID=A0A0F9N9A1_9ZZZZ